MDTDGGKPSPKNQEIVLEKGKRTGDICSGNETVTCDNSLEGSKYAITT